MELDTVDVWLCDERQELGTGMDSDANGHPLDAVARLARELAGIGRRMAPSGWQQQSHGPFGRLGGGMPHREPAGQ